MSERKEKTMLKWLKQKPTHGQGTIPVEKITDDPLATIQVHPNAKKSKNKANEIYAVSRVNPLFEEEEGKGVFSPGGNSGSSGYDSGSGPSDDDFPVLHNNTNNTSSATSTDLKDLQANIVGRLSSSNHPSAKHLFINTENDVIHHEAAILGPNGRPVLQILEQNPNYVKSIALSVANARKRPLSPISESSQQQNNPQKPNSNTNTQVIRSASTLIRPNSSAAAPRIYKDNAKSSPDSVGAAKLIKKDTQYVKSIRIGAPGGAGGTQTKRSLLEANRRFSSSSSSSSNGPSRRPSVTFADDVGGGGGSRPSSRKPSIEQDSIVTESLLMMTSGGGATEHARRFSNASNTSSGSSANISSRRNSVSSAQSKSQDEHSSTETDASGGGPPPGGDGVDLEAFANSLRKSRPIKQPNSSNRSTGSSDELEESTSSASSSSSNPSDGYDSTTPPNERKKFEEGDDIPPPLPAPNNPPRTHTKSHKSPFGGIADHYAAAKEIAKEIESYSNGSAKASSKKSLVRDLLLHRSNRSIFSTNDSKPGGGARTSSSSVGFRGAPRHGSSSSSPHIQQYEPQVVLAARTSSPIYYESYGTNTAHLQSSSTNSGTTDYGNYRLSTSTTTAAQSPASRGGSDDWELVRVQQVYVKDESSSQDQQKHPKSKLLLVGKGDPSLSNGRFGGGGAHQGQDHSAAATTASATSNSRRQQHHHPSSSLATPKTSSALASSSGKTAKKILKADDGLGAGARSRLQGEEEDDTDSGNSSDRTYAEVRLEIEGTKVGITTEDSGGGAQAIIQVEEEDPDSSNLPSKVMIVTGDSQNIVVDLAGVPLDLKNAIVSGTALITLPDGLDHHLQPGYTMITIPASSSSRPPSSSQGPILQAQHLVVETHHLATLKSSSSGSGGGRGIIVHNNLSKKEPGVMNIRIGGGDDDKALVISSASSSDDECKLFGVKNKAQIWDVMQHTLGKQHDGGAGAHSGGHKQKKKITTVFPFHPNQASYESPDFTIEGHRLDRQRKKVEHEKKRRCACRLCGMLFFLVAFLGVLVALSMIYTKAVWSYFFDVDQTTVAVAATEPDYYY